MGREIIERFETPNGAIGLIHDPHDGPPEDWKKDRWFVEAWTQLRFDNEAQARARYRVLRHPPLKDEPRDPHHIDIGQVDVNLYRKELCLKARDGGVAWTLIVAPRFSEARLLLHNSETPNGRAMALSAYTSVVAYMLMRAICRGIGKSEVTETQTTVTIDMGEILPLEPKPAGGPF